MTQTATATTKTEAGKTLKVKQVSNRYFAWSERALRWLPVAKAKVVFQ